jgi:hypothetical protein
MGIPGVVNKTKEKDYSARTHLVGRVLVPDGVLEPADGGLHLRNLVHGLLEVGLQLPGGLLGLGHPVCDGLGHPVRLFPHILAGVGERAADNAAESDTRFPLLTQPTGQQQVTVFDKLFNIN